MSFRAISETCLFEHPLERPMHLAGLTYGRGWHPSDAGTIWSRSHSSELEVDAEAFPEPVALRLQVQIFDAGPETPRHLRILSPGHTPVSQRVTTSGTIVLRAKTPRHATGATFTAIRIELDALSSPYQTGLSGDERMLGLRLVQIDTGGPEFSFPFDLSEASAAQCAAVFVAGWTAREGDGVWSEGDVALLHLPGELSPCGDAVLCLEGGTLPRSEAHPPLLVELREAGMLLATWRADERWRCPLPDWENPTDRRLELTICNLLSPVELGLSTDARRLGLRLRRLSLVARDDGAGVG